MQSYEHFQLHRLSDGLVYEFMRMTRIDGSVGYQRQDQDRWITFRPCLGWVAYDEAGDEITGRSWNTLPSEQGDHPPEGEWVSKKGVKSYVYDLRYVQ